MAKQSITLPAILTRLNVALKEPDLRKGSKLLKQVNTDLDAYSRTLAYWKTTKHPGWLLFKNPAIPQVSRVATLLKQGAAQ